MLKINEKNLKKSQKNTEVIPKTYRGTRARS